MTRWRAPMGERYYTITADMKVDWNFEDYLSADDSLYESGNYFETEAEAREVAVKIRAILDEHHKQEGGGE